MQRAGAGAQAVGRAIWGPTPMVEISFPNYGSDVTMPNSPGPQFMAFLLPFLLLVLTLNGQAQAGGFPPVTRVDAIAVKPLAFEAASHKHPWAGPLGTSGADIATGCCRICLHPWSNARPARTSPSVCLARRCGVELALNTTAPSCPSRRHFDRRHHKFTVFAHHHKAHFVAGLGGV